MRILVIRFSSIGDIVLTTPVLRTLHKQLGAEVHFLTKKQFAPMLQPNPYIYKVWEWEKKSTDIVQALQHASFDIVIDLHKNLRSLQIKRSLGVRSYSFYKANVEKWLMVNLKWNRLPKVHIVDRYMATVAPLGVKNDGQGLDFFIAPKAAATAQTFLAEQQLADGYLALVLGAAHATKVPPLSFYEDIIQKYKHDIVLIGGPAEQEKGKQLAQQRNGVVNAAGAVSIATSAAIIRQAGWVVTPDTGMMHIAAALDKDIISVWGSTIPEFGMYPYRRKGSPSKTLYIENKVVNCRPCSKIGYNSCPKQHFKCMCQLPTKQLWNTLKTGR